MNILSKTIINRTVLRIPALLAILILTGCAAVGPDYVQPETSVAASWHSRLEGGLTAEEIDPQTLASWWTTLNDPELSSLVKQAVAGNLDLKNAWARVREARARRGLAKTDMFPTLDITGSDTCTRSSKETGTGQTTQLYKASFDSGWELDIFGGVRRSVEAAEADLQAAQENLHDVLVSLLAEVALNYIEVRTYQSRLNASQGSIDAQNETYQLTLWRYQAGLSDELATHQARYNLESTRSQIPILRTGLDEAMNRIAVLLGEQPGKVHKQLEKWEPIPETSIKVAVGVPPDLLRRRPDIRQAERELAAQTARIGVATADLYPKFKLSGSIGMTAPSLNHLLTNLSTTDNWALSGGPQISWTAFDAGAVRRNIEIQSALQEQALIQYEATVISALEEVENALMSFAEEQRKRDSLHEATQAAQMAVELAQDKYEAGLADFSDVLDAQRSLLSFEDQLAQSNGTVTSNLIRLYKALGGGWTSMPANEKK